MSKNTKIIISVVVVVIVIVLAIIAFMSPSNVVPAISNHQNTFDKDVPAMSSAANSSNQGLDQDTTAIDAQLNRLNIDASNVSQAIQ